MTGRVLKLGLIGPVPPPNGGMAMQTEQLVRLLRGEGIEVTLLPVNPPYRPGWVGRVPGLRALVRLLPYLVSVWHLAGRVDVIHLMANSGWSWQLFAAPVLWLAALRKTPVVVNYRGGEAEAYFERSFRRVKPSLDKAAVVAVPSGFLEAVFARFGQATRVVPNIIDLELFRPREREPRSADSAAFELVITRNLELIYGIDIAIQALARVRAAGCPARLSIAGSGPAETSLKSLVTSLGLDDAVTFLGRLDRSGVVALYQSADVMVNPTHVDNMPNSVLEALACGVPVVSTDVGGVPYILQHEQTGLLVPPAHPERLADAILRLWQDPELKHQLGTNGLAEVEQYTWARVRDQWLDTYSHAIHRAGKQAA